MATKLCLVMGLLLCLTAEFSAADTLRINKNLTVTYIFRTDRHIMFRVSAKIAGWIAIGFEVDNVSISDYYRASVRAENDFIFEDCYVPVGGDKSELQVDTKENWATFYGFEYEDSYDGATRTELAFARLFNTGDTEHDIVLQDKTLTFLWAYSLESDDFESPASYSGSLLVNFFGETEDPDKSTSPILPSSEEMSTSTFTSALTSTTPESSTAGAISLFSNYSIIFCLYLITCMVFV